MNINKYTPLFLKSWEGKLSKKEKKELDQWLAFSPENQQAYERQTEKFVWEMLIKQAGNDPERIALLKVEETPVAPVSNRIPLSKVAYIMLASASVAAIILLVLKMNQPDPEKGFDSQNKVMVQLADGRRIFPDTVKGELLLAQDNHLLQIDSNEIRYIPIPSKNTGEKLNVLNEITTPKCRRFSVVLPDSSNVVMNANSIIRFPVSFAEDIRSLEFTGEGYFQVQPVRANNKKLPFVVNVTTPDDLHQEVTVTGTTFNISAYGGELGIKTTLLEGAVKVKSGGKIYSLSPYEELLTMNSSWKKEITRGDIMNKIAWKNGYFSFSNASMREIVSDLSRWYGIGVVMVDCSEKKFTGRFLRSRSLDSILAVLSEYYKYKYVIRNNQVTISKDETKQK